jgi:hypothetical protein
MSDTITYASLELSDDYSERFAFIQDEVERISDKEVVEWIMYLLTIPRCVETRV